MSGRLRAELTDAADKLGVHMKELTVLAPQNDPYRVDTPAGHRDGSWLAVQVAELIGDTRTVHLRGLHYAVIGRTKPNGKPYTNTDKDWKWLSGTAAKAARWLGYLPFDRVVDQRNSAPVIRVGQPQWEPEPYVTAGFELELPDVDDIQPKVGIAYFDVPQPYRIVFFGEKSSLEPVLGQVADRFDADLYLPSGEISDTMLHTMANRGSADGRPMVVLCFSDCDPAGWNMPISICHKLQALQTLRFPELEFDVYRVGLLPEQVREYGLPSTPLKATEKRAEQWIETKQVQQTEIDALAALQPDLLRRVALAAVAPFYDAGLARRVSDARWEWREEAQRRVDESMDADLRLAVHARASETLDELREKVAEIEQDMHIDISGIDLPEIVLPEPEITIEPEQRPLVSSRWGFAEQVRALIADKHYDDGDAS